MTKQKKLEAVLATLSVICFLLGRNFDIFNLLGLIFVFFYIFTYLYEIIKDYKYRKEAMKKLFKDDTDN